MKVTQIRSGGGLIGELVRLKWFDKNNPRPTGGEWDETWIVVEDRSIIIATDPENPYPAGEIIVLDPDGVSRLLIADVEVIQ